MNLDELKSKAEGTLSIVAVSWGAQQSFEIMLDFARDVLELIDRIKDLEGTCPMCRGPSDIVVEVYSGTDIKAYTRICKDPTCLHHWLPLESERVLDNKLILKLNKKLAIAEEALKELSECGVMRGGNPEDPGGYGMDVGGFAREALKKIRGEANES